MNNLSEKCNQKPTKHKDKWKSAWKCINLDSDICEKIFSLHIISFCQSFKIYIVFLLCLKQCIYIALFFPQWYLFLFPLSLFYNILCNIICVIAKESSSRFQINVILGIQCISSNFFYHRYGTYLKKYSNRLYPFCSWVGWNL